MRLDQKTVDRLASARDAPDGTTWDDAVPGLGLRLQRGRATWVCRYRVGEKQRQVTLGPVAGLRLPKARELAGDHVRAARGGVDLLERRKAAAEAKARESERRLDRVIEAYLETGAKHLRPATLKEVRRALLVLAVPLHAMPADDLPAEELVRWMKGIRSERGEGTSRRAKSYLSACLAWAVGEGVIGRNCLIGIKSLGREHPRDRTMSDDELRLVWQHLGDGDFGDVMRLLALTGCRREEIAALRWSEVCDLDGPEARLELPAERTKGKKAHIVPLPPMARAILTARPRTAGRQLVFGRRGAFSGFGQCLRRLHEAIAEARGGEPLAPWSPHDLRRTCRSGLVRLGVDPVTAELVIGHRLPGVLGVYDRYDRMPERRRALERWAEHVARIVGGEPESKVVPLKTAIG